MLLIEKVKEMLAVNIGGLNKIKIDKTTSAPFFSAGVSFVQGKFGVVIGAQEFTYSDSHRLGVSISPVVKGNLVSVNDDFTRDSSTQFFAEMYRQQSNFEFGRIEIVGAPGDRHLSLQHIFVVHLRDKQIARSIAAHTMLIVDELLEGWDVFLDLADLSDCDFLTNKDVNAY